MRSQSPRPPFQFSLVTFAFCILLIACGGGTTANREHSLAQLRTAIEGAVSSAEKSAENSRLLETILEDDLLHGLLRSEVEASIGRGDPCSRHPRCAENDFQGDDWYYTVGTMGEGASGALPALIVGFDRSGRVDRTWNLRTH